MSLFEGKVLKAYTVQEQIGAGGFGAVYRAVQPSIDREVAIKIILPHYANQPEFIRRFETEAQLVARLEHPYVVPLYDYWRDPNGAYLVMRYLRGGSLRDSIEEHGAWEPARVVQLVNQISAALAFAHVNGVIHRDLKTDNILIDELGNTYLTDFGIAKDLGQEENLTKDNILGTPAYLAPEQIRGQVATPQSDLYALGILTFETLTGHKPFYDATPATVLFKQLHDPLPDILDFVPDLPPAINMILQRATSKDPDMRYETTLNFARDLASLIRETAPGMPSGTQTMDVSITEAEEAIFAPQNPYKGLRAFQQADSEHFFGREVLVQELVNYLSTAGANNNFLAVVGPSGSGKSSVVKAGLLPKITQGMLDQEIDWFTIELVPGTHPLEELEAALLSIARDEVPGLLGMLQENERGLVRSVKRILPDENSELVIFIDQFEEIFTLVEDEDRRLHILKLLISAIEDERSRIRVIITLRADFYDRPLLYKRFGELIREHTELVLPLNESELERAIVGPAERVGLNLEKGLVGAIINDVNQQPGALPLLQYALTELFERRDHRTLTAHAYQEIGGTAGALARRAEELFQSFTEAEQAATRQLFLRLVSLGEGTEDTRRRVFQMELLSLHEHVVAMRNVIDQFGKYRLLTFDNDPQTRNSTVEVAHEALIRQWQRVRSWLDENREGLRLQRRLTTASEEWLQSGRDVSFLARGVRLQQFEGLANNPDIALNQIEQTYVRSSVQAREEREAEEKARQEREERLRQQRRNMLTLLTVGAVIAAIVGFGLAIVAIQAQQRAESALVVAEENAAETRSLALAANARNALIAGEPMLALPLAIEAAEARSPILPEVLRTFSTAAYAPGPRFSYDGHSGSVMDVAFSQDGLYGFSASVDGTIVKGAVQQGEDLLVVEHPGLRFNAVAAHPQNESFAGAASDGAVYVYDFENGDLLFELTGHEGEVLSVDYSPDGAYLLTGGIDHSIRLWDAATGEEIRVYEGHTGTVYEAQFSPDGTQFVSSSGDATLLDTSDDEVDRTARIWDVQTGEELVLIAPRSGFVRTVAYSPLGDTVALGVWDSANAGTIRIYDAATGEEVQRFFSHTVPPNDVVYSADGTRVISVAWDRFVRINDLQRGVEVASYTGFGDRLLAVDISRDGQFLLLAQGNIGDNEFQEDEAVEPTVWLWDLQSRDQIVALTDHRDWVWAVDFSADNALMATGVGPFRLSPAATDGSEPQIDTAVRVWDVETHELLHVFEGHSWVVDSLRFHPDGETLFSAGWDGLIIRWNLETGEQVQTYQGHDDAVNMIRLSEDGSRLYSAGGDGLVIVWDTETGEQISSFAHEGGVISVALSPDESQIVTASGSNIIIWDAASGEQVQTLSGHTASVNEAIFHPDGQRVFSTSWDATVRLWDVASGEQVGEYTGHNDTTWGLAVTSDGSLLLTTSSDQTVRLWDVETAEELHRYAEHTNWVLEVVLSPDETMLLSAAEDNTARLWRLDRNLDQLLAFVGEDRFVRDLTCAEREVYRLELCNIPAEATESP